MAKQTGKTDIPAEVYLTLAQHARDRHEPNAALAYVKLADKKLQKAPVMKDFQLLQEHQLTQLRTQLIHAEILAELQHPEEAQALLAPLADRDLGERGKRISVEAKNELGNVLYHQQRYAEAAAAYESALVDLESHCGNKDFNTRMVRFNLYNTYVKQGRQDALTVLAA